ncbi:MAG: hypothetical protein K9W43_13075 [Candidatus Thorarchaeota archaeon]|nr:hypothetical protein [Candidatus Thorarchaeota archaeon]
MTSSAPVDQRIKHVLADDQGPTLTLSIDPAEPRVSDEPTVSITAVDVDGVDTVILSYKTSSSGSWTNKTADKADGSTYTAKLPPTDVGTNVTYKAYANDSLGNWGISDTYSYITGRIDQEGPEIVLWYTPDEPEPGDEITAYASIGDPYGVAEVKLAVSYDGSTWTNQSMSYDDSTMVYSKSLGSLLDGQTIYFKIYASDNLGNWAVSELITISFAHTAGTTSTMSPTSDTTTAGDGDSVSFGSLSIFTLGGGAAVVLVIILIVFSKFKR